MPLLRLAAPRRRGRAGRRAAAGGGTDLNPASDFTRAPAWRAACDGIATRLVALARSRPSGPAPLAGVSGIDGGGKTAFARDLATELRARGAAVAELALDPWHEPAEVRFSATAPARTFYDRAFRWEALFAELVDPLRRDRRFDGAFDLARGCGPERERRRYRFERVDLVLLEGVFLFRRERRSRFDFALWIDCPFDVALARALARNQEGLPEAELRRDYAAVYHAAQRIHLERDEPARAADAVFVNGAPGPR